MAICDGTPYAIDFLNPAPDFDYHSIKADRFEWVVETMSDLVIRYALGEEKPAQGLAWQSLLDMPGDQAASQAQTDRVPTSGGTGRDSGQQPVV
jgi:hypothetical protein